MTGAKLTDDEITALATCNAALQASVRVTLDEIDSSEATFMHEGTQISVTSGFASGDRQMAHVCTTDDRGSTLVSEDNVPL